MVVRVEVVGEKATTINLFRPYLDDGVRFENDYTAQGQLYNWNNATPHVLDCVIGFRSFEGVLSDDPRPFSHITHIGLVHEPFNTGRIQCDLSIDTSGVVADSFGPSGQSASDLFAMSVYQGSNWSIGDPSHLMAARTRHIDLTTEQLHKVDASGGASDTGITLHVFTTVPYAQMARLDWASVTVRLTVRHTPIHRPVVLPLDLRLARPTFPTCVPTWCTWVESGQSFTSGVLGRFMCVCVDGASPPPLDRTSARIPVLNTWVPGQHAIEFLMVQAPPSKSPAPGAILDSDQRVILVVTSSRMEIDATNPSGTVIEGPSALAGSPILFQSTVPKFTSRSVCGVRTSRSTVARSRFLITSTHTRCRRCGTTPCSVRF